MKLTIQPATQVLRPKSDGTGFELCREGEHRAILAVGNVCVAFDGRNNWAGTEGYSGEVIELAEYKDCPVRLGSVDCPKVGRDPAEILLCALAADLGYTVTRSERYDHAK
jgi:hypothetical protein